MDEAANSQVAGSGIVSDQEGLKQPTPAEIVAAKIAAHKASNPSQSPDKPKGDPSNDKTAETIIAADLPLTPVNTASLLSEIGNVLKDSGVDSRGQITGLARIKELLDMHGYPREKQ